MTEQLFLGLLEMLGKAGIPERLSIEEQAAGVRKAKSLIALVRDQDPPRVMGIGDDFMPRTDIYNALGAIYPLLPPDQREDALAAYMAQMDQVNFRRVQDNHTPYIREPLVLGGISSQRTIYWPGLDEGKAKVSGQTFSDFSQKFMVENGLFRLEEVRSDFVVAYAALRSDISTFGSEYARACHPEFLRRVVSGIVTMRFTPTRVQESEARHRLREILPHEVQEMVDQAYQEIPPSQPSVFPPA